MNVATSSLFSQLLSLVDRNRLAKLVRETCSGRRDAPQWQIELFFKAIKQNLRIKTFVGDSPNAVRIQIWTALDPSSA